MVSSCSDTAQDPTGHHRGGRDGRLSAMSAPLVVVAPGSWSGRLVTDAGVAEGDVVAVTQRLVADPHAVHPRAVGGTEVDQHVTVAVRSDLGVVAADVRVG